MPAMSTGVMGLSSDELDRLAHSLHWKMWHLEPTDRTVDEEWSELDDQDKDYYRIVVDHILLEFCSLRVARPTTATYAGPPKYE